MFFFSIKHLASKERVPVKPWRHSCSPRRIQTVSFWFPFEKPWSESTFALIYSLPDFSVLFLVACFSSPTSQGDGPLTNSQLAERGTPSSWLLAQGGTVTSPSAKDLTEITDLLSSFITQTQRRNYKKRRFHHNSSPSCHLHVPELNGPNRAQERKHNISYLTKGAIRQDTEAQGKRINRYIGLHQN